MKIFKERLRRKTLNWDFQGRLLVETSIIEKTTDCVCFPTPASLSLQCVRRSLRPLEWAAIWRRSRAEKSRRERTRTHDRKPEVRVRATSGWTSWQFAVIDDGFLTVSWLINRSRYAAGNGSYERRERDKRIIHDLQSWPFLRHRLLVFFFSFKMVTKKTHSSSYKVIGSIRYTYNELLLLRMLRLFFFFLRMLSAITNINQNAGDWQ